MRCTRSPQLGPRRIDLEAESGRSVSVACQNLALLQQACADIVARSGNGPPTFLHVHIAWLEKVEKTGLQRDNLVHPNC